MVLNFSVQIETGVSNMTADFASIWKFFLCTIAKKIPSPRWPLHQTWTLNSGAQQLWDWCVARPTLSDFLNTKSFFTIITNYVGHDFEDIRHNESNYSASLECRSSPKISLNYSLSSTGTWLLRNYFLISTVAKKHNESIFRHTLVWGPVALFSFFAIGRDLNFFSLR